MRSYALNPRAPAAPAVPAASTAKPNDAASAAADAPAGEPTESPAEAAARDGGFHESSYELQHGLQVSESEWPDDVTVPGGLGER